MSPANPDFLEIPVQPQRLDAFSRGRALWRQQREGRNTDTVATQRRELLAALRDLIERELTSRQRDCVRLYFLEGRSQQEVAAALGISRRVVSQHLFGIRRKGKRVGGALKRMRKLCRRRGLEALLRGLSLPHAALERDRRTLHA
jgi:DNA-binding CsgD family transcriptional regulator